MDGLLSVWMDGWLNGCMAGHSWLAGERTDRLVGIIGSQECNLVI